MFAEPSCQYVNVIIKIPFDGMADIAAALKLNLNTERGLGRFPFVRTGRSDRPVRKWNGSVLRTDRAGADRTGPVL